MDDLLLVGRDPRDRVVPIPRGRDVAVRVQGQLTLVICEDAVLRKYITPAIQGYGPTFRACSTVDAFNEKYSGDLRELLGRVPGRIRAHVAVPEVPYGFSELVDVRCQYHVAVAAERLGGSAAAVLAPSMSRAAARTMAAAAGRCSRGLGGIRSCSADLLYGDTLFLVKPDGIDDVDLTPPDEVVRRPTLCCPRISVLESLALP